MVISLKSLVFSVETEKSFKRYEDAMKGFQVQLNASLVPRNHLKAVPVFGVAQRRWMIVLGFVKILDFEAAKQRFDLLAREAAHRRVGSPGIPIPEEMTRKAATRADRLRYLAPNCVKMHLRTEWQADTRVD